MKKLFFVFILFITTFVTAQSVTEISDEKILISYGDQVVHISGPFIVDEKKAINLTGLELALVLTNTTVPGGFYASGYKLQTCKYVLYPVARVRIVSKLVQTSTVGNTNYYHVEHFEQKQNLSTAQTIIFFVFLCAIIVNCLLCVCMLLVNLYEKKGKAGLQVYRLIRNVIVTYLVYIMVMHIAVS